MSKVAPNKDKYLKAMSERGKGQTPMQHYDGGFWSSMSGFTSLKARDGEQD